MFTFLLTTLNRTPCYGSKKLMYIYPSYTLYSIQIFTAFYLLLTYKSQTISIAIESKAAR